MTSTPYVAAFLLHVHAVDPDREARVTEALLRLSAEDLTWFLTSRDKLSELRDVFDFSLAELSFSGFPTGLVLVDDDEDTQAVSTATGSLVGDGRSYVRLTREQMRRLADYGVIPGVKPEIPRVVVDDNGVSFHFRIPEHVGRYATKSLPWEEMERIR